jgi:hypothetical protein
MDANLERVSWERNITMPATKGVVPSMILNVKREIKIK